MGTVADLSNYFDIPAKLLSEHLMEPLAEPYDGSRFFWDPHIPEHYASLLAICDGVDFFGRDAWDCFHLWGSTDFDAHIMERSFGLRVFPIFGQIPHLASIKVIDGAIVATDWEVEGDTANGWLAPIAPSLSDYVVTTIKIRDAYGYHPDGMHADWWQPYALHGSRFDLEQ